MAKSPTRVGCSRTPAALTALSFPLVSCCARVLRKVMFDDAQSLVDLFALTTAM